VFGPDGVELDIIEELPSVSFYPVSSHSFIHSTIDIHNSFNKNLHST
jgi:hypothetical protein